MTRILLIRHGQSANNAQPEHLRVADPELTDIGKRQAMATARGLQGVPLTHLYCSPFRRALETVRPISEAKNLHVHVRGDIFEQGGCYSGYLEVGRRGEPGMGRRELLAKYPGWHIDSSIADSGWWGKDYETLEQATHRAESVAEWILSELVQQPGIHALVIHADFKALLLRAILAQGSLPLEWNGPLKNVGITELSIVEPEWQVHRFNCVKHLDAELVTH